MLLSLTPQMRHERGQTVSTLPTNGLPVSAKLLALMNRRDFMWETGADMHVSFDMENDELAADDLAQVTLRLHRLDRAIERRMKGEGVTMDDVWYARYGKYHGEDVPF